MLTRSAGAGLALTATVALAALHGLVPALPRWVVGVPAWLAGLLIWPDANRRTRRQVAILVSLGLLAMVIGRGRGGAIDLRLAIGGNALLIAMLAAVSFLRLVTRAEAETGGTASRGRRALWSTLLGVHLFGAVINLSVVFIMADRLAAARPLRPRQICVLTRGFSAAAFWSPFFAAMAAALSYAPGASLPTLVFLGMPIAAFAIAFTGRFGRDSATNDFEGYPMRFATLWLPATLAALILALNRISPAWPVLTIICLLAPSIATASTLLRHRGDTRALRSHIAVGLPSMANELLLFLGAAIMAAGIATVFVTLDGWLPFSRYGGFEAVLTLLFMYGVALAGVHPVIGIAVLGTLFRPLDPDPNLLAMTFLCAWGASIPSSPFSGMNLALQGRFDLHPMDFLRWNGVYSLSMLTVSSAALVAYAHYRL